MNKIEQYLTVSSEFRQNGSQADKNYIDFYKFQLDNVKKVDITSIYDIPEIKESISKIKKIVKLKGCYSNSCKLIENLSGIDIMYVEGYMFTLFPIIHAFNKIGDKYIDITREFAFKNDDLFSKDEHYSIIELNRSDMYKYMAKCNTYGEFMIQYFYDHRKKEL